MLPLSTTAGTTGPAGRSAENPHIEVPKRPARIIGKQVSSHPSQVFTALYLDWHSPMQLALWKDGADDLCSGGVCTLTVASRP